MGPKSQERNRRGPPRRFDRDDVLDRLVGLFWMLGYDQTSHAEMRAATGLSGSSLYNAFGSKRDIFEAVLERYHDRTFVLVAPLFDGPAGLDDLSDWVEYLRCRIQSTDTPPGCLMIATMGSPIGRDDGVQARSAANLERVHDALEIALRRAALLAEIPTEDVPAHAALLCAVYVGALAAARNDATRELALSMLASVDDLIGHWRA